MSYSIGADFEIGEFNPYLAIQSSPYRARAVQGLGFAGLGAASSNNTPLDDLDDQLRNILRPVINALPLDSKQKNYLIRSPLVALSDLVRPAFKFIDNVNRRVVRKKRLGSFVMFGIPKKAKVMLSRVQPGDDKLPPASRRFVQDLRVVSASMALSLSYPIEYAQEVAGEIADNVAKTAQRAGKTAKRAADQAGKAVNDFFSNVGKTFGWGPTGVEEAVAGALSAMGVAAGPVATPIIVKAISTTLITVAAKGTTAAITTTGKAAMDLATSAVKAPSRKAPSRKAPSRKAPSRKPTPRTVAPAPLVQKKLEQQARPAPALQRMPPPKVIPPPVFEEKPTASCFPADAKVLTVHGYRPISEIKKGALVVSGQQELVRVKKVFECGTSPILCLHVGGRKIRTTGHHTFLTDRGWVKASGLRLGDRLEGPEAGTITRFSTEKREKVYNLHTTGDCTFVVEGVVAHNFTELRVLRTAWSQLFAPLSAVVLERV